MLESSDFDPGRSGRNHLRALALAAAIGIERVEEVLALVELDRRRQPGRPRRYSLGMRQRLGLAAALLGDPELLVLDEPANGLDPAGVHWLRGFLRQFARSGGTVLISSHVLAEIAQTVDSVLIINRGRLVATRAIADLDAAPGVTRGSSTWSSPDMIAQLRSELLKQRTTRTTVPAARLDDRPRRCWSWRCTSLSLSADALSHQDNQMKILGLGTSIGALFAALLGALSITAEIRTGTIRPTFLVTPRRARVIMAKTLASMLAGAGVGLIAEALVAALEAAGLAARGIHVDLGVGYYAQVLAGGALASALFAAIGVGVGAVVRNQVAAVAGLCVWLLFLEPLLTRRRAQRGRSTRPRRAPAPSRARSRARSPTHSSRPRPAPLLLALYAAIAAATGAIVTARRDVA